MHCISISLSFFTATHHTPTPCALQGILKKKLSSTIWLAIAKMHSYILKQKLLSLSRNFCLATFAAHLFTTLSQTHEARGRGRWGFVLLWRIWFLWHDTALSLPFCGVEVHKIYTLISWPALAN